MEKFLEVDFKPNENSIFEIENWLKNEFNERKTGFYCNIQSIKECYNEESLITLKLNKETIGFTTYFKGQKHIEIGIFEIRNDYRKHGYGTYFINQIADYFSEDFIAIKLFCEPSSSENFWKKVGFVKFPDVDYLHKLTYYKPIIKCSDITSNVDEENKIELWSLEPYQIKLQKPNWIWNIPDNRAIFPIIHGCDDNWNIRITKNGAVINEGKIKHVNNKNLQISFNPFLFINEMHNP